MKVILVAPTPPPIGGISSWTKRMLETDLLEDWDVQVVDSKIIGNRNVFSKEKKNIFTEIKRLVSIWHNLWRQTSDEDVKIVHSCIPAAKNSMFREIVCLLITKIKRKKFVIHYRCTVSNMISDQLDRVLFSIINRYSDNIIVLNEASKEFIDKKYEKKIKLIPNFIETDSVSSEISETKETISKVLYVGGVTIEKGCKDIIEAAKKHPSIQFRLVGSINEKIAEMKKTKNVILLGERDKQFVKKELYEADIFLFPSYFIGEGFSNSLVEAMAMGLPCIVSDWAANKDMVEDKGGLVIPIRDSKELAVSIDLLSNNYVMRKQMSRWNIDKVKSEYIDTIIIKKYVDIYNEVAQVNNYES